MRAAEVAGVARLRGVLCYGMFLLTRLNSGESSYMISAEVAGVARLRERVVLRYVFADAPELWRAQLRVFSAPILNTARS